MGKRSNHPVNDISFCIERAKVLEGRLRTHGEKDRLLCLAITALAGDAKVGMLAYLIWRIRSELRCTTNCLDGSRREQMRDTASFA
jgi:hypothetical protein